MHFKDGYCFYNEAALVERLTVGAKEAGREIVFLVGAPISAPVNPASAGVADVSMIIDEIRQLFMREVELSKQYDDVLATAENRYQAAFLFLLGMRGQDAANSVIRKAVLGAKRRLPEDEIDPLPSTSRLSDDQCKRLEDNIDFWELPPGVRALGELIAEYPDVFGSSVLTSNFDPLIQVSIQKAGGKTYRTVLHRDGNINQTNSQGCHIVHVHGYWRGADTLHTPRQLSQPRPRLLASLRPLLKQKTVVVLAYSGWDDVFAEALSEVVIDDSASPEILWTFFDHDPAPSEKLRLRLDPGIDRGRVSFYCGIDCHKFLPDLLSKWRLFAPRPHVSSAHERKPASQPIASTGHNLSSGDDVSRAVTTPNPRSFSFASDRPPVVEAWVGRASELQRLTRGTEEIIAICGIAGQGKSTLAAQYLKEHASRHFDVLDWRDCREEDNRIQTHIISAINHITEGNVSANGLQSQGDQAIAEIFISCLKRKRCVVVFDNVDQYVDLERGLFTGLLNELVNGIRAEPTGSRIILTCRPQINYVSSAILTIPLTGISENEAIELFEKRGAGGSGKEDICRAHHLTDGHPFWLDLMAVQVTRNASFTLPRLLSDIRRGHADLPNMLTSIWESLPDRERIVLRSMAETVRPETQDTISNYVSADINYNKCNKAIQSLKKMNLIVVKPQENSSDLLELHPIVRQYIRHNFPRQERIGYISKILHHYAAIMNNYRRMLGAILPFSILELWSQKAELHIEAASYEDAFKTLKESCAAFLSGGHIEEYVRVAKRLFEAVEWKNAVLGINEFDDVFSDMIECLSRLDRVEEADSLLVDYEKTIPIKNARYINYCDLRCYSYWFRKDFVSALEWGERGSELKKRTNVDTEYDCEHNLALARRDSGDIDKALEYFQRGRSLSDVTAAEECEESLGGPYYGNVGRCLHLKGDYGPALKCYQKSARLLEEDDDKNSLLNRAYARQWIAETLEKIGDVSTSLIFYHGAKSLWRSISPITADNLSRRIDDIFGSASFSMSEAQIDLACSNWIRSATLSSIR